MSSGHGMDVTKMSSWQLWLPTQDLQEKKLL